MTVNNSIGLQYQGYAKTAELWTDHLEFGLEQLTIPSKSLLEFNGLIPDNLLLGKRVEQFVISELEQMVKVQILLSNKQIQNGTTTVGEIDCLLMQDGVPIHLEIVFKFYLYDPSIGKNEIEHWIGPNRNDTLKKKLAKLAEKQFPLLHNPYTKPLLNSLGIEANKVKQRVCFKAQLFTPYKTKIDYKLVNKECLRGFYVHHSRMEQFETCEFFIPNKFDWLQDVHNGVDWLPFDTYMKVIRRLIQNNKAPLCWIKFPDGSLQKFFVVWWSL
ncbi:DUF1853 family protein [Lutimonas sp.]|uniref:DUF1853 family protein n=1 Tax=Lutimonas sp. TaxID=1872403 RepID=UPI003D9B2F2B